MKIKSVLLLTAVVAIMASGCQNGGFGKKASLKSGIDSVSYALGIVLSQPNKMGLENAPGGKDINLELLANAYYKTLKGDTSVFSAEKANELISGYFQKEEVIFS